MSVGTDDEQTAECDSNEMEQDCLHISSLRRCTLSPRCVYVRADPDVSLFVAVDPRIIQEQINDI